jgi:DNA-binding MarR family transcriptional regulator
MFLNPSLRLLRPSPEVRELAILSGIEKDCAVSQRALARAAAVSPTMVNAYVDAFVGDGRVEVTGDTNRTYRYYLTPAGRARREELSALASREALEVFRGAREEYSRRLETACRAEGVRRVVLFGATEAAELTALVSERAGVEVLGVVDPDPARRGTKVAGHSVEEPAAAAAWRPDAVLVTLPAADREQVRGLESRGFRVMCL